MRLLTYLTEEEAEHLSEDEISYWQGDKKMDGQKDETATTK